MAGPTKADYEQMIDQVYNLADDALTPKTTRSEAIDALQSIYELTAPEDDEDEDSEDSEEDDEEE